MSPTIAGLALDAQAEDRGRLRLVLRDGTLDACSLTIDPLRLRIDGADVRVDGVGNVETHPERRRRGLATALVEHAIERMRSGGAVASLLYGIDDYYDRFGWRSCGDERWVRIPLDRPPRESVASDVDVRPMRVDDMAAVVASYDAATAAVDGALARPANARAWSQLDPGDALVAVRGDRVVGWAWRGAGRVPEVDAVATRQPDASVWAELQALDDAAMSALARAACTRAVALEPAARVLVTGAPEAHGLRRLARAGILKCTLVDEVRPNGGAMLLPFVDDATLDRPLYQFLPDRF